MIKRRTAVSCLVLLGVFSFGALITMGSYFRRYRLVPVATDAMEPTLRRGEIAIVDREFGRAVEPGDIVMVRWGKGTLLSRVVASGRQTVSFRDGALEVHGSALEDGNDEGPCPPTVTRRGPGNCRLRRERADQRSWTIARTDDDIADQSGTLIDENDLLIIGDYRDASFATKEWGRIHYDTVTGHVIGVIKGASVRRLDE